MSERIIVNLDRSVIILVIVCIIYYLLNLKSICLYAIAVTVTVYHWQKLNNTKTLSSCAVYRNMFEMNSVSFYCFYIRCYVFILCKILL
jgi:hypothetical protein